MNRKEFIERSKVFGSIDGRHTIPKSNFNNGAFPCNASLYLNGKLVAQSIDALITFGSFRDWRNPMAGLPEANVHMNNVMIEDGFDGNDLLDDNNYQIEIEMSEATFESRCIITDMSLNVDGRGYFHEANAKIVGLLTMKT